MAYYDGVSVIRIYNLSDWSVIQTLTLALPNLCAIWTFDDRYLITFPTYRTYFLVYDRTNSFTQIRNISFAYTNRKKCIAHQATNSYLCMGGPNFFFSLNLFDFSIASLFNVPSAAFNWKASEDLNFIVNYHYDHTVPARFFKIHKYCTGNKFYRI
jgi:hypothetical protein